jgi:hypothetical protein
MFCWSMLFGFSRFWRVSFSVLWGVWLCWFFVDLVVFCCCVLFGVVFCGFVLMEIFISVCC